MFKHNSFFKKLRNQLLSINDSIESSFNKLNSFINNLKKNKFDKHNRAFYIIGSIVILTLGYFLLPTIYDKSIVKSKIKNQILKNYNIEIDFNDKVTYGLLPTPHFNSKKLSIMKDDGQIAIVNNFKVFINFDKFFSINNIKIKDIIFKKVDFRLNKNDISFFNDLLFIEKINNKIFFKNSNIFFLDAEKEEVLFINKIKEGKYFYDENNQENMVIFKNEIFNVPYKVLFRNNKLTRKLVTEFDSNKIRLSVKNNIDYGDDIKKGILNIMFINHNTSIKYDIKKNSLLFSSSDRKDNFEGAIFFKPFYLQADFRYNQLNSKLFLNEKSILHEIIKSEILNNKNLSMDIKLKINKLTNINHLNDIILKLGVQEGNLTLSNSSLKWKNDLNIILKESFINFDDNEVKLIGKIIFDYRQIENFYKSYQVKKKNRKKVEQIDVDFVYNFSSKKISFDNVKIDNKSDQNLEKFINNFNSADTKLINKVIFKNFINNFFSAYAG